MIGGIDDIAIENIGQSGARNGAVYGHLELADKYPYQFGVHDELMLIVPREAGAVLGARERDVHTGFSLRGNRVVPCVAEAGRTTVDELSDAVNGLIGAGANVIGAVLNRA